MSASNKHYAFIMLVMLASLVGISFTIGGIVGVTHPQRAMDGFRMSMIVGIIPISIFHFAIGRRK